PGAAVRVVLQRVEIARLRAELERQSRHLAGRAGMVRRELPARLGLRVAAPAGGEHDRRRVDQMLAAGRAPAVLERGQVLPAGTLDGGAAAAAPRLAEAFGDRVAGGVADLEQALLRRAAAPREAIAAVLARESDSELLEPVDRLRRRRGEDL